MERTLLDDNSQLNQLISDLNASINSGRNVSITVNVQIGNGTYSNPDGTTTDNTVVEQAFSINGFNNIVQYLQLNGLSDKVQINQGQVGPSENKVISNSSVSIQVNTN